MVLSDHIAAVKEEVGLDKLVASLWDTEHVRFVGEERSATCAPPRSSPARPLGERHAGSEAALSEALLACDPAGRYAGTARFGYAVARKPVSPLR